LIVAPSKSTPTLNLDNAAKTNVGDRWVYSWRNLRALTVATPVFDEPGINREETLGSSKGDVAFR
jgi:hypothetical protein